MAKQKAPSPKESEAPKKKKTPKKIEGVWNCNLYIRGYGRVVKGEEVHSDAVALLKDPSKYVS